MNTYIIDNLFEKFTLYSSNLLFKDSAEADKNETEDSKKRYKTLLFTLNDKGYFDHLSKGNHEKASEILNDIEKRLYEELNPYYIELKKITNLNYHTLRNFKHLSIIRNNSENSLLTASEEAEFKTIYNEELEYFNLAHYRYDFQEYTLFNKLSIIFLLFSTIMRMIKNRQNLSFSDQNINEYYLNNFLVSHGFLYYNNISYDKKKIFVKHIMEFFNRKGSLDCIEQIIKILSDKEIDIYEYYLFYDEDFDKYVFLKVKPNESFIKIFNELRSDREQSWEMVVLSDPSWMATEQDLKDKNIKFIKTKYFSIDSYSDMSDASRELSLLVNKTRRYKDIFGSIYKFDLDGFNSGVELTDFLMFLTLLAMRVNGFSKESISVIEANENMRKYLISPKCYEFQLNDHVNKQLSELIVESIQEQQFISNAIQDIEAYKKESKIDINFKSSDRVNAIRKELNNNYAHNYRPTISDGKATTAYDYLTKKYSNMKSYLDEQDASLLSSQFLSFVDSLETMLILYGQSAFKFKDIYANLYLPKITEIISFFKSINSYLLEFNSTLLIEKDSRQDIISDSNTVTGIIKISNRDSIGNGNSGDPDYMPDMNFPNKDKIVDKEIDLGDTLLNGNSIVKETEAYGPSKLVSKDGKTAYDDVILYDFPRKVVEKSKFLFSDFGNFISYINDNEDIFQNKNIFDIEKQAREIAKDKEKFYSNGLVIDFYGSEGKYKEIREFYGLSYIEFKDKIIKILNRFDNIFNSIQNRFDIKKEDFLYHKDKRIPYMRKTFLYQEVQNEIKEEDILYQDLRNRSEFTDVLYVYEYNKDTDKYEYADQYNKKYRSVKRKESPKYHQEFDEFHTGKRHYKEFIESMKELIEENKKEDEIIGSIPIPDMPSVS